MTNTILSDYPRSVTSDGRVVSLRTLNTFCHNSATIINRLGTRGDSKSYYRDQYALNAGIPEAEQVVFDSDTSATVSKRILHFIFSNHQLQPEARILDVGCGRGLLLREFARHSETYRIVGIEPNQTAMLLLQDDFELSKLELYKDLSDYGLEDNLDLILLTNVIEHVEDPKPFLEQVVQLLKPGALLFVGAPNFENNPLDLLIADHLTRFTPRTISVLFSSVGLTIVASVTTETNVAMWWLLRKSTRPIESKVQLSQLDDAHIAREYAIAEANQNWLDICLETTARAINDAKRRGIPIILYGTGSLWPGTVALDYSLETDIDYIVDDNQSYWNTQRWGHTIQRPFATYIHIELQSLSVICSNPCYSTRIAGNVRRFSRGSSVIAGACAPLAPIEASEKHRERDINYRI